MEIGGFITEGAEIVNHDNTLSGNGTVDSPLGVVNGYNETVLYSGHISAGAAPTAYSLSEPISAFVSYRVYWLWNEGTNCAGEVSEFYWDEDRPTMNNFTLFSVNRFSNTNFTALGLFEIASNLKDITYTFSQQNNDTTGKNIKIKKIVGINRISGQSMEDLLANAFNTGDIKIVVVAAILYLIIHFQRKDTSKKRDADRDELTTRVAVLERELEDVKSLDLSAKLAQIQTDLNWIKEKMK